MAEYSSDVNTSLYKYRQPIYVTEPSGERQTYIPLKLILTDTNFNFDLSRTDGTDFRLAESSNGTGVLQMWIAYWNAIERRATLWFKLPEILGGEVRTLYAFWGFEYDTGVSDLRYLLGESTEGSIIYTDDLALGASTSGSSPGTISPDNAFDGTDAYCDIIKDGWVQCNLSAPERITKLVARGDGSGYYGAGFELRASNDNFVSEDVLIVDITDNIYYYDREYYFGNDNSYSKYRIVNDKGQVYWRVEKIALMAVNEAESVSTPVFRFGDDFLGGSLDVNKWPSNGGSWSISSSEINLGTDAWIRSPDVLGGQSSSWLNFEYELRPIDAFWGSHQHTGNCYLGFSGWGGNELGLIDGVVTSGTTSYSYISSPGCDLGVDMGSEVANIKRLRVYWWNYSEHITQDLYWNDTSWCTPYWSNDNSTWTAIYTFSYQEMPLQRAQDYVWYIDLVLDAPGLTARYFRFNGKFGFAPTSSNIRVSEIKVFADDVLTLTEPGTFIIEDGIRGIGSPTSTSVAAHRYRCYGGENVMGINYYWEGATDRYHDFVNAGSYITYPGTNKGLIENSYNQTYFGYYEGTDRCYQGMTNRGGEATPQYSDDLATESSHATALSYNTGHPEYWKPYRAVDGDPATQWIGGSEAPMWWGYYFDEAQPITRITIYMSNQPIYDHQIEASNDPAAGWDDKVWDLIIVVPGSGASAVDEWIINFDNTVPYLYWRIVYPSGGSPYLPEVEMYKITHYSSEFDYDDSWERKVHRNTEVSNFRIYGEDQSSANGVAIDWVIVRDFDPSKELLVNTSNLYIDHEYIGHQPLDGRSYGPDVTNVDFHHLSDMGGDPYRMSDNATGSPSTVFISDDSVTTGNITIDFGRTENSINSVDHRHYNSSNSVYFYNASKLSDHDADVHDRDYWQTTTTSGWAAIKFDTTKDIACLAIRAVPGSTSRMAKDFKFYGSQYNPRFSGWDEKVLLYEGEALPNEQEQVFYFSTGLTYYKYYILDVLNTHGGNIAIQEWELYERDPIMGKRVISQLRLRPVTFTDNEYYYPKQVSLSASNNGYTWDLLLPSTDTPTPFTDYAYGRWSRYSFDNFKSYYQYKLTCVDNWRAADDKIKMSEWEMVERSEEAYNVRVLDGDTNYINNIWADPTSTLSSGTVYFTNDKFSTVEFDKLIHYATLSGAVDDFNIRL